MNAISYKLLIYKPKPESELYKFTHTEYSPLKNNSEKYINKGLDPVDFDVDSETLYSYFNAYIDKLKRFPYDTKITRKFPIEIDKTTGYLSIKNKFKKDVEIFYNSIEDYDKQIIKLNWKNLYELEKYNKTFKDYLSAKKEEFINLIKNITEDIIESYDITNFMVNFNIATKIDDLQNDLKLTLISDLQSLPSARVKAMPTSIANLDRMEILKDLTELKLGDKKIIIEENDIIELRVKYSDDHKIPVKEGYLKDKDGFTRIYIGFITAIKKSLDYGKYELLTIDCAGLSKMFFLYSTQFTPSIGVEKIFEDGIELSDTTFSPWGNKFHAKSAGEIFSYFMRSALLSDSYNELNTYIESLNNEKNYLAKALKDERERASKLASYTKRINALERAKNELNSISPDYIKVSNLTGNLGPSENMDINFYFSVADILGNSENISFQTINYIPILMYYARKKAANETLENSDLSLIIGTKEAGDNLAYATLLASAFKQFYPTLQKPSAIMSTIRTNAFLEIFEDRPGIIRMRPPKYNIINLNTSINDTIEESDLVYYLTPEDKVRYDYILDPNDIVSIDITRSDPDIISRVDSQWYIALAGEPVAGYTGHYSDASLLMKYGLRASGPITNPLALSQMLASYVSALQMADSNKKTRQVVLKVYGNREYNVGQLYYVPAVKNTSSDKIISRGFVGYISQIQTTHEYNKVPLHTLTLTHIRIADILKFNKNGKPVYYANFKRLPDLSTFIREMSLNKEVRNDISKASKFKSNRKVEKHSRKTSDTYEGQLVIHNGLVYSDNLELTRRSLYKDTLRGMGLLRRFVDDDIVYEAEKDTFITPFLKEAFLNKKNKKFNISKNFLAKLTVLGLDPKLKLYPLMSGSRAYIGGGDFINIDAASFYYFDISVLKKFIFSAAYNYVQHVYTGKSDNLTQLTTKGLDFSKSQIQYVESTDINNFIKIDLYTASIFERFTNIFKPVFIHCHIYAKRTGKNEIAKTITFHVPSSKYKLLENLINYGSIRSSLDKFDIFSSGNGIIFSNVDISLWSINDIINNCAEFDFKPAGKDNFYTYDDSTHIFGDALFSVFINPKKGYPYIYNGASVAPSYVKLFDNHRKLLQTQYTKLGLADSQTLSFKDYLQNKYLTAYVPVPLSIDFIKEYFNNILNVPQIFKHPIIENGQISKPSFALAISKYAKIDENTYKLGDIVFQNFDSFNKSVTEITDNLKISVNNFNKLKIIGMSNSEFIDKLYAAIMVDNMYYVFSSDKYKELFNRISLHPLAYFWHLSYKSDESFNFPYDAYSWSKNSEGRLNLFPVGLEQ